MYKSLTTEQYRKHLGFSSDYRVNGVLCYGTLYEEHILMALQACLNAMDIKATPKPLPHPFLRFGRELNIDNKIIWFVIGYGGAWLSEYLHWACLFGSGKNILVGGCGGLKHGINTGDFIVPESSYGQESSVRLYNRESPIQVPDKKLSARLADRLGKDNSKVWRGPMVTNQAMIGETLEDVYRWSEEGYIGVEMEASTVFAVSNHFKVPSAASMYVGDNLIEKHHNMSDEYSAQADMRNQNQKKQITAALELLLS